MTIFVQYTKEAAEKREELILGDKSLRSYFAATFQSLKSGELFTKREGQQKIAVFGTKYTFVLDIDTDNRVRLIDIVDIE